MFRMIILAAALLLMMGSFVWAGQTDGADRHRIDVNDTEWSHMADLDANPAGALSVPPRFEQVIYTLIPDVAPGLPDPRRSAYFFVGAPNEVDALANIGDFKFHAVINDKANLVFSLLGDPPTVAFPAPDPLGLWQELAGAGSVFVKHATQSELANGGGPGIKDPLMEDLDAVELYQSGGADDADCYSQVGDPALAGDAGVRYSVRFAPNPPGPGLAGAGYVPHSDIVNAIRFLGWTGTPSDSQLVDLDGLMVKDDPDGIWNAGDMIMFTIRANANWHGGEIVVLPFVGKPGSAFFLFHGGKLWNTASSPGAISGTGVDEIDALEAKDTIRVPSLTNWGLLVLLVLLVISGIIVIRQRRSAVRAA